MTNIRQRLFTRSGSCACANNRIQKWIEGDIQGVTIAGSSNGIAGVGADSLYGPAGVTMDDNETYLFVSDSMNNRVQRFTLL